MANNNFRYSKTFIRTVVLVSKNRRVNHFRIRSRQEMVASLSLSNLCQMTSKHKEYKWPTPKTWPTRKKRNKTNSYLNHDSDGLDVSLEVKVKELVLQPLCKAGGHLSFQLLHILISRSDEVPFQNLPTKHFKLNCSRQPFWFFSCDRQLQ